MICEACALNSGIRQGWISEYAFPGTEGLITKRTRKPQANKSLLCPECYETQDPGVVLAVWAVQGERKAMTIWIPFDTGQATPV